jgi:hypothetical protein
MQHNLPAFLLTSVIFNADKRCCDQLCKAIVDDARSGIRIIRKAIIELHHGIPCTAQVLQRLSVQQRRSIEKHVPLFVTGQGPKAGLQPLRHRLVANDGTICCAVAECQNPCLHQTVHIPS